MALTVEWKKVIPGFLKIGVHAYAGNTTGVVTGAIDTASAFSWTGPVAPTADQGARLLLQRATYAAAMRTIARFAREAPALAVQADPREMEAALCGLAQDEHTTVDLSADAFAHPERWPSLDLVEAAFGRWQAVCGVAEGVGEEMRRAFRDEVPLALQSELRDDGKQADYAALIAELNRETPVDAAAERARHWAIYRARLVDAVHKPLRSLDRERIRPYSLSDLYIPLRAAVGHASAPGQSHRTDDAGGAARKRPIVWLDEALKGWIAKPERGDVIRVLAGDPGAGKSSACAMLAADLARERRRVLLVPLGRLDYTGDPWRELSRFVGDELGHDALDGLRAGTGEPLVLILDGLDELAKAGQGAAEIVTQFTGGLERHVLTINQDAPRLLLLLAGRPGAASATGAHADHARLDVLRYVLPAAEHHRFADGPLIKLDQRADWWGRFDPEHGMPAVLTRGDRRLDDLSAQPLLNWLLAQVLTLEGSEAANSIAGVHDLYTRLFDNVLDRVHRERRTEAMDGTARDRLERMLEEAAVAVWHRGERTVALSEILDRLKDAELDADLERIGKDRSSALRTLLDSFFCRAHSGIRHEVMEFTHKSFAEFLTARRIVREIAELHERFEAPYGRRHPEDLLASWMTLCGPAAIDRDLMDMLCAEVAAPARQGEPAKPVAGWRRTLTILFQECVNEGMPWPGHAKERARAAERRVRNAEVALLVALNATVRKSFEDGDRSLVTIDWSVTPAPDTLHRLIGPWASRTIACYALAGFDLSGADLSGAYLFNANLNGADLSSADLNGADLSLADLNGASLTGAKLAGASLTDADLTGANLTGTELFGADLTGASLAGAKLTGANLTGANLTGTELFGADLTGAKIDGVRGLSSEDIDDLQVRTATRRR